MKKKFRTVLFFLLVIGTVMASSGLYVVNPATWWADPSQQWTGVADKEVLPIIVYVSKLITNKTELHVKGKGEMTKNKGG
ncbi:hypothetical protein, partial [Paenibacillus riograndensis]